MWRTLDFLAAYEHNIAAGVLNAIEFGSIDRIKRRAASRTARISSGKKRSAAAPAANTRFVIATRAPTQCRRPFRPGLEAYGRPGDHAYQAGPIVAGEHHIPGTAGNLEYRIGMVAGINAGRPRQTWLMQLEYEFF